MNYESAMWFCEKLRGFEKKNVIGRRDFATEENALGIQTEILISFRA